MSDPTFNSLIPPGGPTRAGPVIAALPFAPVGPQRPYLVVNFVSSADGRAAVHGRSRALGDPGDRAIFHSIRERVDAVLVGASTARAESYGRIIPDPERRARRVAAGRSPEPLAVIVTRSGDLPLDAPLFAEPDARVVVFSGAAVEVSAAAADVRVEPLGDDGLPAAMAALRSQHGIETVLCEGGPHLFGALLRAGLVDELFLTLAAKLAGGDSGPSITAGSPLPELAVLSLAGLLQHGSTLYLRYQVTS